MKYYAPYKYIRQKALIFGLPLPYFAGMMTFLILSLLVIIFSFSFSMVLLLVGLNGGGYVVLLRLASYKKQFNFKPGYPKLISNRQYSPLNYDSFK